MLVAMTTYILGRCDLSRHGGRDEREDEIEIEKMVTSFQSWNVRAGWLIDVEGSRGSSEDNVIEIAARNSFVFVTLFRVLAEVGELVSATLAVVPCI